MFARVGWRSQAGKRSGRPGRIPPASGCPRGDARAEDSTCTCGPDTRWNVPDEFPTLEAALAVSIIVLAWRLGLLSRALGRVGASRRVSDAGRASGWERGSRRASRARGRAGADLVIAAVLGGALVFAQAANFEVRLPFYVLGAIAFVLLLASARLHSRLARAHADQIDRSGSPPLTASPLEERPRMGRGLAPDAVGESRSASGPPCPECGSSGRKALSANDDLGAKLASLGVEAASLCTQCGHLEGRARAGTW